MTARNILVTGAAGKIGAAIAQRFGRTGDRVIGVDFRESDLEAAMAVLPAASRAGTVVADLSDLADVERLVPGVWD